ncbi:MAG: hypothetical protein ABL957_13965 [Parvularculaceae bacterium]
MNLWRWAALSAVAVIAIALGFLPIPGMDACSTAREPTLAFELVKTPAEAAALFPDHCRSAHMSAQRTALHLDIWAFVPAYSILLILSFLALRREGGALAARAASLGMVTLALAALFDWFENYQLLRILDDFPGSQATIDLLIPAPRAKFILLGLAVAGVGALHFARGLRLGRWRMLAGGVTALGGLVSAGGVLVNRDLILPAAAAAWLALMAATFILAARKPA